MSFLVTSVILTRNIGLINKMKKFPNTILFFYDFLSSFFDVLMKNNNNLAVLLFLRYQHLAQTMQNISALFVTLDPQREQLYNVIISF